MRGQKKIRHYLKIINNYLIFLNSTMEPWDGPAAIAGTDNEWVIAANDRNGLRPLRYAITKDKFIFAGSETGMIELNEKKF
jgi:glutamate synthase (NADPH/NADH) large chain